MSTSTWSVTAITQPADTAVVWVRPTWFTPPILATWSASAKTWTLTSGLIAPWYIFWRWQSQ